MEEFVEMQKKFVKQIDNCKKFNVIPQAILIEGNNDLSLNKAVDYITASIFSEDEILDIDSELSKRIYNRQISDVIEFNLSDETLKKENILKIQEQFSKTALEVTNKQVYIIKYVDNASSIAMNALLKFLEEPNKNVYAIFTTNNTEKVLETILSRLIVFRLANNDIEQIKEVYYQNYDKNDVNFVSLISNDEIYIKNVLDGDIFKTFKKQTSNSLEAIFKGNFFVYIYDLYSDYDKDDLKIFFELFYIMMTNFSFMPYLGVNEDLIDKLYKNLDVVLDVTLSSRLQLDSNANKSLILDRFCIEVERALR